MPEIAGHSRQIPLPYSTPPTPPFFDPQHAVTWPERVASAVVGSEAASAEAQAAAWKLAYRDWPDLTARERLTLLIALRDLALASSPLQAEVAERLEALTLASGRVDGAAGDEDGRGDAVPKAEPSAAGPRPARVGVDDWVAWRAARRLGLRRSLGTDARGRRYWALGGGVGAFRLFVEWPCAHETDEAANEEDRRPREWGWYEGSAIDALRAWLEAGDIGVEADVREALESAPWPRDQLRPGMVAVGLAVCVEEMQDAGQGGALDNTENDAHSEFRSCSLSLTKHVLNL